MVTPTYGYAVVSLTEYNELAHELELEKGKRNYYQLKWEASHAKNHELAQRNNRLRDAIVENVEKKNKK